MMAKHRSPFTNPEDNFYDFVSLSQGKAFAELFGNGESEAYSKNNSDIIMAIGRLCLTMIRKLTHKIRQFVS